MQKVIELYSRGKGFKNLALWTQHYRKRKTQFAKSITTRHHEKFNHHPRIKYKKLHELIQTWLKPWTCCYNCLNEAATAGLLTSTYRLLMDAWYAPTYEKEQDHISVNDTKYLPSSTDISKITLLGKG